MFKRKMRTAAAERSTRLLQKGVALEGRTTETRAWAVESEGSGIYDFMGTGGWDLRTQGWRIASAAFLTCLATVPSLHQEIYRINNLFFCFCFQS
jgi:hypothetical protein